MIINVKCTKTGDKGRMDIGDMSQDGIAQTKALHDARGFPGYECHIGHHVELGGGTLSCLELDWPSAEEGKAPSGEAQMAELKAKFNRVYTSKELNEPGCPVLITGFCYGEADAEDTQTGEKFSLRFTNVPDIGRVYYGGSK